MAEEDTQKNSGSINYSDNPELVSEFADLKAGDTGSSRFNFTVRRNEDGTLEFDIGEIVLPDNGVQPVSGELEPVKGSDVVGDVLNREKPASDSVQ